MKDTERIRGANGRLRRATDLDETAVRFSWGYHDGAADALQESRRPDGLSSSTICEQHYDPAYAAGYVAGNEAAHNGAYDGSSSAAWVTESRRFAWPKYAPYRQVRKPAWSVERAKAELPDVQVRYQGRTYQAANRAGA
mgnify:CR=1 FL=1